MHLLCFVAKHCERPLWIIVFICGQRTGTVFIAYQVAFSALSFLTTGSFQRVMDISQASLSYCLPPGYDALLSTSSLVQYNARDEEGHSNVFNIPDSHNLLCQNIEMQFPQEGKTSVQMFSCQFLEVCLKKCGLVFNKHT